MSGTNPFVIRATPRALSNWTTLDAHLKAEIREHAEGIAGDPAGALVRASSRGAAQEAWTCEFRSKYDADLAVRLVFTDLDLHAGTCVLVSIVTRREP